MDDAFDKLRAVPSLTTLNDYLQAVGKVIVACDEGADSRTKLIALRDKLNKHAGESAKAIAASSPPDDQVWNVVQRTLSLHTERIECALADYYENKAGLMANAQTWGIHFSDVRHIVTTLLFGVSWAVVMQKWDDYDEPLLHSAMVIWALAVLLYIGFTANTFDKMNEEKKSLRILLLKPEAANKTAVRWGWWNIAAVASALLSFVWLLPWGARMPVCLKDVGWFVLAPGMGVLWILAYVGSLSEEGERKHRKAVIRLLPDFAVWAATIGFGVLLYGWPSQVRSTAYQLSISPANGAMLVQKVSGETKADEKIGAGLNAAEIVRITTAVQSTLEQIAKEQQAKPGPKPE